MRELGIDIETYSSYDLKTCGVYRYVEAPDWAILLFAYAVDGGPVQCVDLASGESLPEDVRAALTDPAVTKTAYNARSGAALWYALRVWACRCRWASAAKCCTWKPAK